MAPSDLTKRLSLRVTDIEDTEIRREADAAGLTMSDYAKKRILGRPVASATDVQTINELRRLGGLLKHNASAGDRLAVNAALDQIRTAIERLGSQST